MAERPLPRPIALLVATSLVVAGAALAGTPSSAAATPLETALLAASNAARAQHDLPALRPDPGLARAARPHAGENAARGVLDHGSPDPSRDTPLERVGLAGVALVEVGENLALIPGGDVAAAAVRGWLASPPHRANLLNPDFTHVGFGTAEGPGGTYVAQLFGARPLTRSSATAEPVVHEAPTWTLDVRGPAGTRTMLFVQGDAVAGAPIDPSGTTTLSLPATEGALVATLGIATSPGRYAVADRVRLTPDGDWRRVDGPAPGPVRISGARLATIVRTGVEVALAYQPSDAPLRLLLDGAHQPEVAPRDGVLRAWLPEASSVREVAVGVADADGRIRVLERFQLTAGADPELLPGAPAGEESAP
jgi:uncharacterized protein YkwD